MRCAGLSPRRRFWAAFLLLGLALPLVGGCNGLKPPAPAEPEWFQDVTQASGIRFVHHTGQKRAASILETTGSGCGFWDFDGDGWLDVFLVNARHESGNTNALYRNDGHGHFVDVTQAAGLQGRGFGMGCAVGDYDGDGLTDLYVCNYGRNELFRNRGDGTFEERGREAGVDTEGWSTGAAFFDADRDGDLDLYVGRYSKFGKGYRELCTVSGLPASCSPRTYPSEPDIFYENLGNGRFRDATARFGFSDPNGRAQGVFAFDYDDDGWTDLFVPNDTTNNYLFHNQKGKFKEVGLIAGVAFGGDGRAEASMGCDAGDSDGDGAWDLVVGNFQGEMDALYRRHGALFEHSSVEAGIGEPTLRVLTFGIGFLDYDNDGWLDIAQVNGHVNNLLETVDPDSPYRQPRQLFRNQGKGRYSEVTRQAGSAFTRPAVGRGLAFGDYDNDGRVDLLVNENNGPAALLHNTFSPAGHWLLVKLEGPKANRLGIGAQVELTAGGMKQRREVRSTASFVSVNDARCHFGLGDAARVDQLRVRWPDGRTSTVKGVPADQVLRVRYDEGR